MSIEVGPSEWPCLDSWWAVFTQTRPITRFDSSALVIGSEQITSAWVSVDEWGKAATVSPHFVGSSRVFAADHSTDSWGELDPWWDVYTEVGYETAVEIVDLLERSNRHWRHSAAPFDTDPLASESMINRGPLPPRNEEQWSNWLARLLRSSEALVNELFDIGVEQPPQAVIREEHLTKDEGTFRRPDILILHRKVGISIEVKLDDTNYGKTAETAQLVERDYPDHEWTHTILLPAKNIGRLRAILGPFLRSRPDDGWMIEWEDPGPVSVIFWRDVTSALRKLLTQGDIVDDHWAANAFLFCAVAEQQILGFRSLPVVQRLAEPATVIDAVQPISLADTLEEQLTYLGNRANS